jgi:hypothetical protein
VFLVHKGWCHYHAFGKLQTRQALRTHCDIIFKAILLGGYTLLFSLGDVYWSFISLGLSVSLSLFLSLTHIHKNHKPTDYNSHSRLLCLYFTTVYYPSFPIIIQQSFSPFSVIINFWIAGVAVYGHRDRKNFTISHTTS